jgi:acyl carrier protein
MRYPCWCVVFLALNGCTDPSNGLSKDNAEAAVRAVISSHFNVASAVINMDRSITDPPLNADELDLVEMIMELEERHGIEISDAAVNRVTGGTLGKGPSRITPNQLASIVRGASKK